MRLTRQEKRLGKIKYLYFAISYLYLSLLCHIFVTKHARWHFEHHRVVSVAGPFTNGGWKTRDTPRLPATTTIEYQHENFERPFNYIHQLRDRENTKGMWPKWVLHLHRKHGIVQLYSLTWGTSQYRYLGKRGWCCTVLLSFAFKPTLSMQTCNKSGSRKEA